MIRYVWLAGAPNRRLRVRAVDEESVAQRAAERATPEQLGVAVQIGGTVCNSYKYPAETEAIFAASTGRVTVVWCSRIPANKATLFGAANACVSGAGWLFHGTYGDANTDAARVLRGSARTVIRAAFDAVITPLELLAASADA